MLRNVAHLWTRRPVRLNVVIHAAGSRLVSGRVREMGVEGMYIETDHALDLIEGSTVRVSAMLAGRMLITQGRVQQPAETGFHLTFTDASGEMPAAIQALITHEPPAATPVAVNG